MARPSHISKPYKLTLSIPEDVNAQLKLHLFSPSLGEVPYGAQARFISDLVRNYFAHRRLEVPGGTISGPEGAIAFVDQLINS